MTSFARHIGALSAGLLLLAACHTVSGLDELEVVEAGGGGAGGSSMGMGARPPCEPGEEEELQLDDDATIDPVQPVVNLNGNFLLVGAGYRTLVGFALPNAMPVHHAQLCLSSIGSMDFGDIDVDARAIGEPWAQEGVTWQGPFGADPSWEGESGHPLDPVLATETVTVSDYQRYCWDVSDHIAAVAAGDAEFFGFILTSLAPVVAVFEEWNTGFEPPALIVNYCAPLD